MLRCIVHEGMFENLQNSVTTLALARGSPTAEKWHVPSALDVCIFGSFLLIPAHLPMLDNLTDSGPIHPLRYGKRQVA